MKELLHYYKEDCRHSPGWHYAHGEAETFLRHDIPVCPDEWVPPVGRSFVLLTNKEGETRKAACFSWIDGYKTHRGLFVFMTDRESVAYASQCFMAQVWRL